MIKTVENDAEAREFVNSCQQNYGLVCFYPTWSGPSKLSKVHVEELSRTYPSLPVIIVDPDECIEFANEAAISAFPTLLIYAWGRVIDQLVSDSKGMTKELISKYHGQVPPPNVLPYDIATARAASNADRRAADWRTRYDDVSRYRNDSDD